MRILKKLVISTLVLVSVSALNPIAASAAWIQDGTSYRYSEGDSWAKGWRYISGKWYHFNECGAMDHDTIVDSWYLDSFGIGTECVENDNLAVNKSTGKILKFTKQVSLDCLKKENYLSVAIPKEIAGVEIKSIGDYSFIRSYNLQSVSIPDSVTSIGRDAFSGCINLERITIPNSVTSIDEDAFHGCYYTVFNVQSERIKKLLIDYGVNQSKIIVNSTSNNTSLNLVTTSNNTNSSVVNENATTALPNSADYFAFDAKEAKIEKYTGIDHEVVLPSIINNIPVARIGYDAFGGCNVLKNVIISDSVKIIENLAFDGCSNLKSITIPDSVVSIGDNAFDNCIGLTDITIPNSVTSIGNGAFSNCISLTSVTIPNSITKINNFIFSGCSNLKSITIPDSVTSIGNDIDGPGRGLVKKNCAFANCKNAVFYVSSEATKQLLINYGIAESKIVVNSTSTNTNLNEVTTSNNTISSVVNGTAATVLPTSADYFTFNPEKAKITKYTGMDYAVVLPSIINNIPVTNIGNYAFGDCNVLGNITISDSVKIIDDQAFACCSNLKSIIIPDSVTNIGDEAFENCISLTNVTIPNNVTSIGKRAFSSCISLTSVTIPNSITKINNFTFSGCSSLKSITIPDSVTIIDYYVDVPSEEPVKKNAAFENCNNATFYVSSEATKQLLINYGIAENRIVLNK